MKIRESGMPDAAMWHTFFDPESILDAMSLTDEVRDVADFGCGYGTFAIPAAKRIQGALHGFDVDETMIEASRRLAEHEEARNVRLHLRDVVANGTGLKDASVDYVMLFNILHAEDPMLLLSEASRILAPGGRVAVIHWRSDRRTPRGPSMEVRPSPEDCRRWLTDAGFLVRKAEVELPPHHFGVLALGSTA